MQIILSLQDEEWAVVLQRVLGEKADDMYTKKFLKLVLDSVATCVKSVTLVMHRSVTPHVTNINDHTTVVRAITHVNVMNAGVN